MATLKSLPLRAVQDTIVIGIGNPLREDDRAGIELTEQLIDHFGAELHAMVVYEPDICLAETVANFEQLIVVDAVAYDDGHPFKLMKITPADSFMPDQGISSHSFSWSMILAMARDLYGHSPKAEVIAIAANNFDISEKLSQNCKENVALAFSYLVDRLSTE